MGTFMIKYLTPKDDVLDVIERKTERPKTKKKNCQVICPLKFVVERSKDKKRKVCPFFLLEVKTV